MIMELHKLQASHPEVNALSSTSRTMHLCSCRDSQIHKLQHRTASIHDSPTRMVARMDWQQFGFRDYEIQPPWLHEYKYCPTICLLISLGPPLSGLPDVGR